MNTRIESLDLPKIIFIDFFILSLVYIIPAVSHLLPFPLYVLDPMRILLFTGLILTNNKNNILLLAVTIPLFSMSITGHPVFFKSILISGELFINMFLLVELIYRTKLKVPIVLIISIIISKIFYYMFKYVFLQFNLIEGYLISTPLFIQFLTAAFLIITFSFFIKIKKD